ERELRGPVKGLDELNYLMGRFCERFSYVPGVTTTRTTASEAFAGGQGVCQDYAHVFLSLCRSAGIPARYVAGMIPGEGATHAWAEVWTQDGWVGMDPTNNRFTDDSYIRLTHGRDFADGAVDKGCFVRFAFQTQQVYVNVEEVAGYV
ncbi:MAG: transglutaminase family protein, partial [Clostridiales bacterium]|nr:transglutaminase family protein [Clostridiales bacterium]